MWLEQIFSSPESLNYYCSCVITEIYGAEIYG